MSLRIGINGFGRMGRLAVRVAWDWPELDFVHINEIKGGPETAAHLLEFDSVHGRWPRSMRSEPGTLHIEDKPIVFTNHELPSSISWEQQEVDLVLECSGAFRDPQSLEGHYRQGVETVLVSAPVKEEALNVVMGCNDHLYDPQHHHLLTAASCTTNCIAPIVKIVHENLGIEHGVVTTIHDVTNTQVVVDAPHKDLRRARSALNSLIPTTTGSAKAITMIYPDLEGKLNGLAVRVPLLNASLVDCVFELNSPTSVSHVHQLFEEASQGALRGILGFEPLPLVSADFVNDPRSAIVDGPSTMIVDDKLLKLLAWYDNELGYVHRMMELARKVARSKSTV